MSTSSLLPANFLTTLYSDSSEVFVDTGPTAKPEWERGTTYLLDPADGHTTAMIAQTVSPTSGGGDLSPVPFTPVNAVVTGVTTTSTTSNADSTSSDGQASPLSSLTAKTKGPSPPAGALGGAAGGGLILVMFLLGFFLYLWRQRRARSIRQVQLRSPETKIFSPPLSPNSLEKGRLPKEMTTSISGIEVPHDDLSETLSEGSFITDIRATDEDEDFGDESMPSTENFTESSYTSRYDEAPQSQAQRSDPSASAGRVLFPQVEQSTADETERRSNASLPLPNQSKYKTLIPQVHVTPTSILKRPSIPMNEVDSAPIARSKRFGNKFRKGAQPAYQPHFAEQKAPIGKKGVTFGEDQIREFGRTPVPSVTASQTSWAGHEQ